MKIGDIIQDYEYDDKGIILAVTLDAGERHYYVLAFECAFGSWLNEDYVKKCKIIG